MKTNRNLIIKISLLIFLVLSFIIVNIKISMYNARRPMVYESGELFVKTIDCADVFDANPTGSFLVSFDAYADSAGDILMYQQNGTGYRYGMGKTFTVTNEYEHYELCVEVQLLNEDQKNAYIAFEGKTEGVIPHIKNISVRLIEKTL